MEKYKINKAIRFKLEPKHISKIESDVEGLIVKEGFDTKNVAVGLEKFSDNIYRILERKLYQKFQYFGLVPSIKSLMAVREEGINDNDLSKTIRLGNICFVSQSKTSGICPVCNSKKSNHNTTCPNCRYDWLNIFHSNGGVAGYNIATRGFENFNNESPT